MEEAIVQSHTSLTVSPQARATDMFGVSCASAGMEAARTAAGHHHVQRGDTIRSLTRTG